MKAFLPDATIVPAFHGQKTLLLLQESLPACLPYHIWQRNKCSMYPTEMIYAQIRPNTVKFYPCNRYKIMLMTVVEHIQYMYTHTYAHTHTHTPTHPHTHTHTPALYTHTHTQTLLILVWNWLNIVRSGLGGPGGLTSPPPSSPPTFSVLTEPPERWDVTEVSRNSAVFLWMR